MYRVMGSCPVVGERGGNATCSTTCEKRVFFSFIVCVQRRLKAGDPPRGMTVFTAACSYWHRAAIFCIRSCGICVCFDVSADQWLFVYTTAVGASTCPPQIRFFGNLAFCWSTDVRDFWGCSVFGCEHIDKYVLHKYMSASFSEPSHTTKAQSSNATLVSVSQLFH